MNTSSSACRCFPRLLLERDDPERCDCVIACVDAALQYVLPPQLLKERTRVFRPADEVNPDEVVKLLVSLRL